MKFLLFLLFPLICFGPYFLPKKWQCGIGWHSRTLFSIHDYERTGFDGCSTHARCKWCKYEGMIDSQGNLF